MAGGVSLFRKSLKDADRDMMVFDRHTQDVGRNIDKLSGRLGLFIDLAATLGPSLIPTAAAAVPLLAGLSNQLGFAVVAGGSAILAFQGVGDALKAVNEQAINPSTENLAKMREAMATLGPAGRDFVRELQSLRPEMQKLQSAAQAGLFPGMTEGIESLTTRLPQAERIISDVSDTVGDLLAHAGDSLAGPAWDDFFHMLETEGRPTLMALGESIGQVTKGLADLWVAFTPLNRDFSAGMLEASRSFADWADGLSRTQGFADFMDYLRTTGPQVAETLAAMGSALLDVLEAAAPLGGPALAAIKAFSNAISAIADSSLGTPILGAIAAWRAYSMAVGLAEKAQLRFNAAQSGGFGATALGGKAAGAKGWASGLAKDLGVVTTTWATAGAKSERESTRMAASAGRLKTSLAGVGKGAAGIAALGVASTGAADKIGLTNTASLALMGTFIAPGWGTAIGAAAGGAIDLTNASSGLEDALKRVNAAAAASDFSALNRGLAEAQKQIDDLSHHSGLGDFISDTLKGTSATLHGRGLTSGAITSSYQKDANAAEAKGDLALRERGAAAANAAMAASSRLAAQGFQLTAAGAREAAMSVDQFTFSMRGASAALQRQGNWDAFRSSVLDAKDAVKEAGKTLQANGDIIRGQGRDMQRAGLQSRGLLRSIAQNAIQTSEGMKNIANRSKFLDNARQSFIGVARSMGISRAAARALANQLGLLDRAKANPKVEEKGAEPSRVRIARMRAEIAALKSKSVRMDEKGAAAAAARIASLRSQIAALHDKTVHINVSRSGASMGGGGQSPSASTGADGATVPKTGLPYADRHLYLVADGERIVSNRYGQVDANRDLLDAINNSRGRLQGFADGGTPGGSHVARRYRSEVDDAARAHATALKASTKAINKEKAARERLVGKRNDLTGTTRDTFLSDPFAGGNAWSAGGGDPRAVLRADIAKAKAFKIQLAKLKAQGLNGDALAAIAATGDVNKAAALAATGKTGVAQYESLYQQRAVVAAQVGKYAGNAAYGPAIAEINKHLTQLLHATHHGNKQRDHAPAKHGRETAKALNGAGRDGKRRARG